MDGNIGSLLVKILLGGALAALAAGAVYLIYRWWRTHHASPPIEHSALLVAYGRRMTDILDRQALAHLLTREVPAALHVKQAALLLPQDHHLITIQAGTDQSTETLALPISHAAVRWVASAGEAQRADKGRLRALIAQGPATLAWTQVWLPMMRGITLRGLWLLGPRYGGTRFTSEDLQCLTTLARQATAVIEAAHYAAQERESAVEMRALYRQVVTARELERSRVARELHDGVLQDLCAVTRDLKALTAQGNADRGYTTGLATRAGETVQALRAICNDLRPPLLHQDLATALRTLVATLDARSPAPVAIEINAEDLHLPDDIALALYRITQEALHNALQHADASEIAVRLTQYPDRLRLTVTDDGRGIREGVDPARFVARGHFGLAGMRERAAMIGGKLDVQTAVDYGTVVILELPRDDGVTR